MQVEHAVLSDIDGVEEVLDDRVGGDFLSSELVSFSHQLAEVSESNAAVLFSVELYAQKKNRVDVTRSNDQVIQKKISDESENGSDSLRGRCAP